MSSQFSEIYEEEHFISVLEADIRIVKELPAELRSLDLEAIGSLVSTSYMLNFRLIQNVLVLAICFVLLSSPIIDESDSWDFFPGI